MVIVIALNSQTENVLEQSSSVLQLCVCSPDSRRPPQIISLSTPKIHPHIYPFLFVFIQSLSLFLR